jgi:hypothetical protein
MQNFVFGGILMKRLMYILINPILLFLLFLPFECFATTTSDEINVIISQYTTVFKAQDTTQLMSFFTDPCNISGTDYTLTESQPLVNNFFATQTISTFEITNIQIIVIDETQATVTCVEHTVDTLCGETFTSCKYTFIKISNQWKISKKEFI